MYISGVFTILTLLSLATATHSQKNYNATTMALTTTAHTPETLKTVIWTSCGFVPGDNGAACGLHTTTMLPQMTSIPPQQKPQSQTHGYSNTTCAPTHKPTSFSFANTTKPVLITLAPATVTATANTTNITTTKHTTEVYNTITLIHTTSTASFANHSLPTTTILASVDLRNSSTFMTAYLHTPQLQSSSNYSYTGNGNYTRPSITNGHKLAAVETNYAAAISDSGSAGASVTGSSGSFSNDASSLNPLPHLSALFMGIFFATLFISSTIA
jgi:hypothetical protein